MLIFINCKIISFQSYVVFLIHVHPRSKVLILTDGVRYYKCGLLFNLSDTLKLPCDEGISNGCTQHNMY